jgi:cytochrome b561
MEPVQLERYGRVAIAFHWAIAVLILINWPLGNFAEAIEAGFGGNVVPVHKSIGLTVLALSIARLGWRLGHPPPPLPPSLPRWRARMAGAVHAGLYLLIIAVPIAGWLRTSPNAYPLKWFGLVELPKFPIEKGSAAAEAASTGHALLAWALLLLAAVHVAAALHHHFRMRDAVLRRMLPSRSA